MSYIPGNNAKGWNDPPQFLHSSSNSTNQQAGQTRNLLNKRISHNLNNLSQPMSTPQPGTTPAMPPTGAPPTIPIFSPVSSTTEPETAHAAEAHHEPEHPASLEEIENIFNEKTQYLKDKGIAAKITDEIQKRVKLFSGSWDKLSETVRQRMHQLAFGIYLNFNK